MLLYLSLLGPHLLEFEQVFTFILRNIGVIDDIHALLGRLLSLYVFLCDETDFPRQTCVQILFEHRVVTISSLHLV